MLLAAGPLAVVAASLCSAWIAIKSDDGLVAEDYYKRGLLINQKLRQSAPVGASKLGATVWIAIDGRIRARLDGLPDSTSQPPSLLRLKLEQPARGGQTRVLNLARDAAGDYVGALDAQPPGRWIVGLESDAWRLPTTIAGSLSEIRLGAAAGRR
jgi:hypothetical protein